MIAMDVMEDTPWVARHNSCSTLEAEQIRLNQRGRAPFSLWKALFYRLPARPLVKFLLLYLGKRGFLDGRAGFTYAVLQSFHEYMIVLKTREMTPRGRTE